MRGTWQAEPPTGAVGQVCKGGFVGLGNSAHRGVGSQTFLKTPSGSSNSGWGFGLRSRCLRDEGPPVVVLEWRQSRCHRACPLGLNSPQPFLPSLVPGFWAEVCQFCLFPLRASWGSVNARRGVWPLSHSP